MTKVSKVSKGKECVIVMIQYAEKSTDGWKHIVTSVINWRLISPRSLRSPLRPALPFLGLS